MTALRHGRRLPHFLFLFACTVFTAQAHADERLVRPISAPCSHRWAGYSDEPVDTCLGPHHYRIPANYFRNQRGPDFEGDVYLLVLWPDLQPQAPGKLSKQGVEGWARTITMRPDYIDRVPIEGLLQKSIQPTDYEKDSQNPTADLTLRDRQPQRFGLTPYYVNAEKFEAFRKRQERELRVPYSARLENENDWYLGYDTEGRLTTVIKCDSHLEPDGFVIEGNRLKRNARWSAECGHEIVIPGDSVVIRIGYPRVLLKDWKRFEDRARELLTKYRVR